MKEQHSLRVFENRKVSKMFGAREGGKQQEAGEIT
jgi:hypothetical protein